ncbi:hypothetical protein [Roseibium sp.]|uniref:hypothetical protein n=1 Tax=Roseibium sp. TaxID=1936156 RepID=UPI003A96B623
MFRKTAIAVLVIASIQAVGTASAYDGSSDPIPTDGIYAPSGPSGECEFVEGMVWDDDADDFVSTYFLECF